MDARVARTRAVILETATDLLVEGGPEALTIEGIVARSGVAKTTIYRHWEGRDSIVRDVFTHCAPSFDPPPADLPFLDKLRFLVERVIESLGEERWQKLFPELMRLRALDPTLLELSKKLDGEQTQQVDDLIDDGIREGYLPKAMLDERDETVVLLLGPLVMTAIVQPTLAGKELTDLTIRQFLAGAKARLDAGE